MMYVEVTRPRIALICQRGYSQEKECINSVYNVSMQSTGARSSTSRSRRFRGVEASPVNTVDGQEIVTVLAEPFQTRYGEDGSFIGEYTSRQHRVDQPILEEVDETSGDHVDTLDYACTTGI